MFRASRESLWVSVVEQVEKKIKRITLIKSVLSSIPIYFLSCFKCPMNVVQRIGKIQWDFLWNDSIEKMKYHLVKWETVRTPLAQRGLGIRLIEKVNKAVLGKWLWRMGGPSYSLWKKILSCKYRLDSGSWCAPSQNYNVSGKWKSILSIKKEFDMWIRYRVHDVSRVRCWYDGWCGQFSLHSQFPAL